MSFETFEENAGSRAEEDDAILESAIRDLKTQLGSARRGVRIPGDHWGNKEEEK